jgi:hypothetical protein
MVFHVAPSRGRPPSESEHYDAPVVAKKPIAEDDEAREVRKKRRVHHQEAPEPSVGSGHMDAIAIAVLGAVAAALIAKYYATR